jgi:hypothetical protein
MDEDDEQSAEAKEALKKLKSRFKKKGGAAELKHICQQLGVTYTEKAKAMRLLAQDDEIRNILIQQGII